MRRILLRIFLWLSAIGVAVFAAVGSWLYVEWTRFEAEAARFDLAEIQRIPGVSEIFDMDGVRYSRLEGQVRYNVAKADIPKHLVDALLAREDTRFRAHAGVDFKGIARAAFKNLRAGKVEEGASTLTQQLARNTFELSKDKWRRKLVEAALALRIEKAFSKEDILAAYLNRIYFGSGAYGVETAARIYFAKSTKDLDLSEAAMLAGLIRSPNHLSPLDSPEETLAVRNEVLSRMRELGMIAQAEYAACRAMEMPLRKRRVAPLVQDYATDTVQRDLTLVLTPEQIARGGLRIYTTIDPHLQKRAEAIVDDRLRVIEESKGFPHPTRAAFDAKGVERTAYLQGALVAIENSTGAIRAVVGGRSFEESSYNRAVLARRQIGSTFKTFVFATAFSLGLTPYTPVDDSEIREREIPVDAKRREFWTPQNSDHSSLGIQPAEVGLIRSRNTMTVRIGQWAGLERVREFGAKVGVSSEIPPNPSIFLGAFETTLLDLTSAYTIFPNRGIRRQTYVIERIDDSTGRTLYEAAHIEHRVLDEQADALTHGVLEKVLDSGTAARARKDGFDLPAAGKTGTTDDYKDAWFLGYTSSLTCGVWVGMDKPGKIMDRGYGSTLALPIWAEFLKAVSAERYAARPFGIAPTASIAEVRPAIPVNPAGSVANAPRAVPVERPVAPRSSYRVERYNGGVRIIDVKR